MLTLDHLFSSERYFRFVRINKFQMAWKKLLEALPFNTNLPLSFFFIRIEKENISGTFLIWIIFFFWQICLFSFVFELKLYLFSNLFEIRKKMRSHLFFLKRRFESAIFEDFHKTKEKTKIIMCKSPFFLSLIFSWLCKLNWACTNTTKTI